MANIYNLTGNDSVITFNIGDITLEYTPSDKKEKALSEKAAEVEKKAQNLKEGDEWENRALIKALIDECFSVVFDQDVTQKIYQQAGENTFMYLKIFFQVAEAIKEVNEKSADDEVFKKYLAE